MSENWKSRIVGHGSESPEQLLANEKNWRIHTKKQQDALSGVLDEVGYVQGVIVNKRTSEAWNGDRGVETIVDGHLRCEIAISKGQSEIPVTYVDLDPAEEAKVLATIDPLAAMAGTDTDKLDSLLREVDTGSEALMEMLSEMAEDAGLDCFGGEKEVEDVEPQVDRAEELQKEWGTEAGQLWEIRGPSGLVHRLLCGDSTNAEDVGRLMGGERASCILTDPPYCSGGFQEAGRSAGSVGTDADHVAIANDRLSTRGYAALLKSAFGNAPAKYIYAFTDWRMWVHLFDISESCGYCVRSMIVWDKGTPGMGRGWRCQHELILWGCRDTAPFDKHASGQGNVLSEKRTGNVHHTTEKPVALIETLLSTAPFIKSVYDPFLGSGTTMVAAEQLNRRAFGMEISPAYCGVILQRMKDLGCECEVMK